MLEEVAEKVMDRIWIGFNLDDKQFYGRRFRKSIKWFGYKAIPAIISITTIVITFWIAYKLYNNVGFEKTIIIIAVLILITGRGINAKIEKLK